MSETDKPNVPELDCLGFMEDVPASLNKLVSSPSEEIKCAESIVFSSFNPPPSHRRYKSAALNVLLNQLILTMLSLFVTGL